MVSTRGKNKLTHPAAPVMSAAAKRKAGIKTKPRAKKVTKDQQIRELEAKVFALENPGSEPFSKEPLFLKSGSPLHDVEDDVLEEPDISTESDSEDRVLIGRKRVASGSLPNSRALKRTKGYSNLEDIRPTVRNKPSGLKLDWHRTVSKPSTPHQQVLGGYPRSASISASSSSVSAPPSSISASSSSISLSPTFPPSPLQEFSDHSMSLLALSPPRNLSRQSAPVFDGDFKPLAYKSAVEHVLGDVPRTLPRTYKDEEGQKQQPAVRQLPDWLRKSFRDRFIRQIIRQVFVSNTPWSNPLLESLQQSFNHAYPAHQIRLHTGDAAVFPTYRDIGVLRNRIGDEGRNAVIEYLPRQYNQRALGSKDARAKYVEAVLADPQHPFIWKLYHPGSGVRSPGEWHYYDKKRIGPFESVPVLRAFSVYFTSHGIQADIPSNDPGEGFRPVGALALAATAVERGYHMHLTGDYIPSGSGFSSSKWLSSTELYADQIENDLTSENWTAIFQALHQLRESDAQDDQVQIGAPLARKQREPLLPADPSTPPPSAADFLTPLPVD